MKINRPLAIFSGILLIMMVGCIIIPIPIPQPKILPPPQPSDPQIAAVGMSLVARAPIGNVVNDPNVFFIKVDEEKGLYASEHIIPSNFSKYNQIYLFNAEPGRYAAVASFKKSRWGKRATPLPAFLIPGQGEYITFFPKELIKLTEVTVTPGEIVFMGDYVVKAHCGLEDAEDVQLHYARLIAPDAKTGMFGMAFSGVATYKGTLLEEKHDKQTEIEFLNNSLKHLKDSDWIDIIQKRLDELQVEKEETEEKEE